MHSLRVVAGVFSGRFWGCAISLLRICHILVEDMPLPGAGYATFSSRKWHFPNCLVFTGLQEGAICAGLIDRWLHKYAFLLHKSAYFLDERTAEASWERCIVNLRFVRLLSLLVPAAVRLWCFLARTNSRKDNKCAAFTPPESVKQC